LPPLPWRITIVGCQVDAATAPVQDDQSALVARLKSSSVALDLESSDIVAITTNSVYDESYGPENAFDNMPAGGWDQATGMEIGDEWNSTTSSARLTRQISAPGSYLKYRICLTAVNGSSVVDLIEIEMNP